MDDIKGLVTRFYDTWNAHDRDGWLACCDEDITFSGPGGISGKGFDTGRMFWSIWQDAFPDCTSTINAAVAEGNEAIQEAVFTGTHTETLHLPGNPVYAGPYVPWRQMVKLPPYLRSSGAHDSAGAHAGLGTCWRLTHRAIGADFTRAIMGPICCCSMQLRLASGRFT